MGVLIVDHWSYSLSLKGRCLRVSSAKRLQIQGELITILLVKHAAFKDTFVSGIWLALSFVSQLLSNRLPRFDVKLYKEARSEADRRRVGGH